MKNRVSCNICFKDALENSSVDYTANRVNSATIEMRRHMDNYHPAVVLQETADKAEDAVKQGKSIGDFVTYGGGFFQAFLYWAIMSYQPVRTVECPNFRAMCYALNPKASTFDRHTVSTKITSQAAWVRSILKLMLVGLFFALTCDHWTSVSGESYLAVTLHAINAEFELISFMLCCHQHTGDSTGDGILAEVQAAWELFGLSPEFCVGVVSDTAPVMGVFGRLLNETFNIPHFYCVDHSLELTTVCDLISRFLF
jgi:hypothetical protein